MSIIIVEVDMNYPEDATCFYLKVSIFIFGFLIKKELCLVHKLTGKIIERRKVK